MTSSPNKWRRLRAVAIVVVLLAILSLWSRSFLGGLLVNLGYIHLARAAVEPGTIATEKALSAFGRAIGIDPDSESAHVGRAGVLLKQGNYEAAIDSLVKAQSASGNQRKIAGWQLGNALAAVGEPDRALAAWQAAGSASYLVGEGQALLARGANYCAEAEASLRRATLVDPALGEARYALAGALKCLGKEGEAAESYCQAATLLTKDSPWRYLAQGHCFRYLGKLDDAIGEYRKVLSHARKRVVARTEARVILSRMLYDGKGDLAGALKYLEEAIGEAPNTVGLYVLMGDLYRRERLYDEARGWLQRARRVNPQSDEPDRYLVRVYVDEAYALWDSGDLDKAESIFRDAVKTFPRNARAHSALGWFLYQARRDAEGALVELEEAMALAPDDSLAYTYAGYVHLQEGRLPDAARSLEAAISRNPNDAEAHANLGMTFLAQKLADAAIRESEKAVAIAPRHARYYEVLGDAYRAAGRRADAIGSYSKALDLEPGRVSSRKGLDQLLGAENGGRR